MTAITLRDIAAVREAPIFEHDASYTTSLTCAEVHVNNVAQIIDRVRELGKAAAGVDSDDDRLEAYLNSLNTETLRRVEATMYSGRNGTSAVDELKVLRKNHPSKDDVVRTIIEKRTAFDSYFDRGLHRAVKDGIDLDTF